MFPGGTQVTGICLVTGTLLVLIAFNSPNQTENLLAPVFKSVLDFQITEGPHSGRFRWTCHNSTIIAADHVPLLYGLSAYLAHPSVRTREFTDEQKKNLGEFAEKLLTEKEPEKIHAAVVTFKAIGRELSKEKRGEIRNIILKFQEGSSGFREGVAYSASIVGTYHAVKTLEILDEKLDENRQRDVITFVLSSAVGGGFSSRNTKDKIPTVADTYFADKILQIFAVDLKTYFSAQTLQFLAEMQETNGGVSAVGTPDAVTTIQALSLVDRVSAILENAENNFCGVAARGYIRRCIFADGIKFSPNSKISISAAYYISLLASTNAVGDLTSLSVLRSMQGFGLTIIITGIFSVLDLTKFVDWTRSWKYVLTTGMLLYVANTCAEENSPWCVVGYISLIIFLLKSYYETWDTADWGTRDKPLCQLWVLTAACGTSAVHLTIFFLLSYAQVETLLGPGGWIILILTDIPATLAVVNICAFFMDQKFMNARLMNGYRLFYAAGYLSWTSSLLIQYSFLYVKGDWDIIHEWASARGLVQFVTVFIPIISQIISTSTSAYAVSLFNQITQKTA